MNIRVIGILALLFLLSCFKSCQEANYALWGKNAEAVITSIPRNIGKYGRELNTFTVTYATSVPDAEDGRIVGGYVINESDLDKYKVNDTIKITYVKYNGRYHSRFVNESNVVYIYITLAFLAAMAVMGMMLWKQAGDDVAMARRK